MGEKPGFREAIDRMLPPRAINGWTYKADITTGSDGMRQGFNAPRPGRIHGGVDINYHHDSGAPLGQNGINLQHPEVGSPVSGKVIKITPDLGKVVIEDANGYTHELRHLVDIPRSLNKGDHVYAGQTIGAMGGKGPSGDNEYRQHVPYTIKSPGGEAIDPEKFWNNRRDGAGASPVHHNVPIMPLTHLDPFTQQKLKDPPQGYTIQNGETLRRDGHLVYRIEKDGRTRGYFIS